MTDDYKAYVLRLQRGGGQDHWRATLVDALSGEKHHFATERDLYIHLMCLLVQISLFMEESEEDIEERLNY